MNKPSNLKIRPTLALLLAFLCAVPAPRSRAAVAAPEIPIHLAPIPVDTDSGIVGQVAAVVLEHSHYSHRPFDAAMSREMFRLYIDELDYNHLIFSKDDVEELRTQYADTLLDRLEKGGDVSPAYAIFNRFAQRLQEREALVRKLATYTFDFSGDETIQLDRHKAPWPASEAEATDLWRKRIEYEVLEERLNKVKPEEQVKNVARRYERLLRSISEYTTSDVLQGYLTAMTRALDPHSDYLGAPAKKDFDITMRLSVFGIGAMLSEEDGYAKVSSLVKGGPADRDKRLKPGDRIEAVAQGDGPFEEIVGMRINHAVELIRGDKGTKVRLKVIPADALDPATRVIIEIIRDEVKLTDQEAKAKIVEVPQAAGPPLKEGVIDLPEFYSDMEGGSGGKSAARDMAKLLAYLEKQGVQGILVDLRGNGGGSLNEAVAMAGLFIKEGPVVQVKDTEGAIHVLDTSPPPSSYSGPLIVLTGRGSASASEIFAGVLQDYGRAVIVGAKSTFGKGTVQALIDLARYMPSFYHGGNPGTLKATIQKFYRVSGASTQNRGVIPDIHLPSVEDDLDVTESSLDNALPYDEVPPASYSRSPALGAVLPSVAGASNARVAASPEFAYIKEDGDRLAHEMKDKTVSLNEKKRVAEADAAKAREEARGKDRAARNVPAMKSVEVTLESLDNPAAAAQAAAKDVEVSSRPAAAVEPPSQSTGTAEAAYVKAPPAPDAALDESLRILGDMIVAPKVTAQTPLPEAPEKAVAH